MSWRAHHQPFFLKRKTEFVELRVRNKTSIRRTKTYVQITSCYCGLTVVMEIMKIRYYICLLYTSDAADE